VTLAGNSLSGIVPSGSLAAVTTISLRTAAEFGSAPATTLNAARVEATEGTMQFDNKNTGVLTPAFSVYFIYIPS
jgi:hypothetical protein